MRYGVIILLLATIIGGPLVSFAETDEERKARIEAELFQLEMQMIRSEQLLQSKQLERQSLERDIDILDAQIDKAQLGIQARAVAIDQLGDQIGDKEVVIEVLTERLAKQRSSIGELIRKTEEVDDYSLIEVLLSNKNLSEFFTDFESFRSINDSLNDSLVVLEEIKIDTQAQKVSLEEKQLTEAQLKELQEQEKAAIEQREAEKERILTVTKGEESAYQELIETQQKSVIELRAQLFELLGGGSAIPFPEAVTLAQTAGAVTGVSPALILAILEQESSFGSNIGSCTMGDVSDGRDIMHPTRDKPVFLAIAETVGFSAATQPVSCPLRRSDGTRIGWGGAMGPSQFIPSTWAIYAGGYKDVGNGHTYVRSEDAIRSLLGKNGPSNPFNNQDAFTATSLLLRDNGANGTWGGDRLAALRYYAGWAGANNPANSFYGDQVMERKARLENEIRILQGS